MTYVSINSYLFEGGWDQVRFRTIASFIAYNSVAKNISLQLVGKIMKGILLFPSINVESHTKFLPQDRVHYQSKINNHGFSRPNAEPTATAILADQKKTTIIEIDSYG